MDICPASTSPLSSQNAVPYKKLKMIGTNAPRSFVPAAAVHLELYSVDQQLNTFWRSGSDILEIYLLCVVPKKMFPDCLSKGGKIKQNV